ncbi:MAG: hypothetical protein IJ083_03270 [Clostridia bacterium]|nr:hypothetical protein [Clostridia bacterium]
MVSTLFFRVLMGLCVRSIEKIGDDPGRLMDEAHGMELFAVYVLVIRFLPVLIVKKALLIYMALAAGWEIIPLLACLTAFGEKLPSALPLTLSRLCAFLGMAIPVLWAWPVVF